MNERDIFLAKVMLTSHFHFLIFIEFENNYHKQLPKDNAKTLFCKISQKLQEKAVIKSIFQQLYQKIKFDLGALLRILQNI